MNKKQAKHIREIADRLPAVYQQSRSGYTIEDDKMVPHFYNVEINHERRLRKAFDRNGLDGIKSYLELISNLQKQRHENFVQEGIGRGTGEAVGDEAHGNSLALSKEDESDLIRLDQTEKPV